jgi:hypothetical protein
MGNLLFVKFNLPAIAAKSKHIQMMFFIFGYQNELILFDKFDRLFIPNKLVQIWPEICVFICVGHAKMNLVGRLFIFYTCAWLSKVARKCTSV